MPTITTTLAGANFRPAEARAVCKALEVGETLELMADLYNEYDSNAVKVYARGEFIGFVPKADNSAICAALLRGEDVPAEVIGFESSIKPIMDIELP